MAVTHYTLTASFTDLLGSAYSPTSAKVVVWVETNVGSSEGIVDSSADLIALGPQRQTADSNGLVTFANLIGSDSDPEDIGLAEGTLQYRVTAEYTNALTRRRGERWSSGWFSLTADTNLADVVAEQYIPAAYISQATELLDGYVTEAEGHAGDAAASAAAAEAARDTATEIALGDAEAAFDGFLAARDLPADGDELSASFVGAVVMVGAGIDPTGAVDSTAAIRAKFTGGEAFGVKKFHFPDGIFKVDGTLLTDADDVEISWSGGAWIKPTTGWGIKVQGARPTLHRPKIRIDGGTPTAGILVDGATRCTINDPVIWAFANISGTLDGIVVDDNAYWCEIVRPRFRKDSGVLTGNFRRLVAVTNTSNACRVWGGDFSHATTGVYASDSNNVVVIGGAFEGVTDGVEVAGAAGCPGLRVLGTRHEDGTSCVKITTTATSINAPMEFDLTRVSSVTNLVTDAGNKGGYILRAGGITKVVPGIALGDATDTHQTLQAGDAQTEAMWTLLERALGGGDRMAEWDRHGNLVFSSPSASWPSQADAVGVLRHYLGNTYLHAVNPVSSGGRVILGVGNGSGANKDIIGVGTNYLRPEADNAYNLGQTAMRFAQAFVVGGTIKALTTLTGSTAIGANHYRVIANGSSITITLPDPTGGVGVAGREYVIKNIHSTALTVVSAGTSKTIDGAASDSLAQWESATYVSDGTQWFVV